MNNKTFLAIAIAPLIAAGCSTHSVKREAPIKTLDNANSGGSALAINAASDRLASGNWSGKVKVWNLPKGNTQREWQAHSESVAGIAYGRDDKYVISAGYDGTIAVWSQAGKKAKQWQAGSPITAFAMTPDRNEVVSGHKDGWVRYWRIRDHALLAERHIRRDEIRSLSVSPNGREIAIGDDSARLSVWNPDRNLLKHFERAPSYARALAFSPDGTNLYGSGWFKVYRWNLGDGKLDVLATDHRGIINSIGFTPSGKLASISRQTDSSVLMLDPASGNTITAFQKHEMCGSQVAISPDGCFMATNSDDALVRVWALQSNCAMPKRELYGLK